MSKSQEDGVSGLERRTRALLEQSAANLDSRVRSRLTQARHAALDERRRARARRAWLSWAPTGAVAAAVLGVLLYVRQGPVGQGPGLLRAAATTTDDLELLADADGMQLAEDAGDYEFYEWAAAAADAADAVGT
jgi:negative regulator of sigma E activity